MKIEPPAIDKLLDPNADLSGITQDMLVAALEPAIQSHKNVWILAGKAALVQERLKDRTTLKEFAKDLGVSPHSLYTYRRTEKILLGLDVPEDISIGARVLIAQQKDPAEVLEEIKKHGLSNAEVVKMLSKTKKEKHKEVECPRCGQLISV